MISAPGSVQQLPIWSFPVAVLGWLSLPPSQVLRHLFPSSSPGCFYLSFLRAGVLYIAVWPASSAVPSRVVGIHWRLGWRSVLWPASSAVPSHVVGVHWRLGCFLLQILGRTQVHILPCGRPPLAGFGEQMYSSCLSLWEEPKLMCVKWEVRQMRWV